ncbi:MAG: hypothetical protein HFE45_11870 [Oscillospiraceae bacterium]|jgi:hypothetical protein|nr:hypothetical protein [Oscillospiraceae bacterium]
MSEKRIEICRVKAGDLKTGFGNPRKVLKKKLDELEQSFDLFGDFGIYLIDEENNVIAGNQRLKVVLRKYGPDTELDCKRLIGYSQAELRAINIKDNTHAGEWDLDLLADWTADLTLDLGIDPKEAKKRPEEMTVQDMELIRYEKYDYVLIVCRNEIDYKNLQRALGLEKRKMIVSQKRKIQARAIWFDDIKAQIISKDEIPKEEEEQ